ncbi:twin-arginine translocase TatA/TatE family subunit [Phycicoccus duodecadis]|uniref:Sec-independent protein translocase protein TatB n=1 Tax=Phycicoccus duodecadis TaxID=173053 RepID=A0A2N3YH30_9MICO|nr:twin-arginine translocase TatA/TatE family subunit [Phycicoccus duodecadis]PKW26172.1 sec-independent protein translocase protein TatB [Phycicoccus duodecadis]
MFGVNGWEVILLALIAVFVLGPDRMPEYAAKLARAIRKLRVMAEGAKDQLRDQLGPEYEDINWRQYDPRQYDPRRIVREALLEPLDDAVAPIRDEIGSVRSAARLRGGADAGAGAAGALGAAAVAGGAPGAVPGDGPADLDRPAEPEIGPHDAMARAWGAPRAYDPGRPVPYDAEAT